MAPFFSIIIPCCNIEAYIGDCLKSLLNQSFSDWEAWVGIETSQDNTAQVIEEVIGTDTRFHVFTLPQDGSPSVLRNTGIERACGQYVLFIDGDDLLAEEALAYLATEIGKRPGADLYPFAIRENNEITGERKVLFDCLLEAPADLSGKEAFLYIDRQVASGPQIYVVGKVYRRQFLEERKLRFVPGLVHEDEEFTPRALYFARRIVSLHKVCYLYRRRVNSLTTRAFDGRKLLEDYATVYHSLLAFHTTVSAEADYDPQVAGCWAKTWLTKMMLYWFSKRFVKNISRKTRTETLSKLFRDGFGDFNCLLRRTTRRRRVAAWWVKVFLRFPRLAWLAEQFFLRIYFPLAEARNARKRNHRKA